MAEPSPLPQEGKGSSPWNLSGASRFRSPLIMRSPLIGTSPRILGDGMQGLEGFVLEGEAVNDDGLESVLSSFRNDSSLNLFLSEDFDAVKHVGEAVRGGVVAQSLSETEMAAAMISARVREQVIRRQDALLGEVEAVSALEQQIESLSGGLEALATTTDALTHSLNDPFQRLRMAVIKMRNSAATADVLQKILRFQACYTRLQTFNSNSTSSENADSLTYTAEAVRELEELMTSSSVDKIDNVARELPTVRRSISDFKGRVVEVLRKGMNTDDQVSIGSALQSLMVLDILSERLTVELNTLLSSAHTALVEGFDPKQMLPPKSGMEPTSAVYMPDMWTRLDNAIERLHDIAVQSIKLQIVLQRKQDPITFSSLIDVVDMHVSRYFLHALSKQLLEHIQTLARAKKRTPGAFLFDSLCEEYPRLLEKFETLKQRLLNAANLSLMDGFNAETIASREELDRVFSEALLPIEKQYLALSLSRVTDPIVSLFEPGGMPPGDAAASSLAKLFAAELASTKGEPRLFGHSAKNVAAALYMYAASAQEFLASVSGHQIVELHNGLFILGSSANVMFGLQYAVERDIQGAAEVLLTLSQTILEKPFNAIRETLKETILNMHDDITNEGKTTAAGGDRYVAALSHRLQLFKSDLCDHIMRSRALSDKVQELASAILSQFVVHAALLPEVSEERRKVLLSDMTVAENALTNFCSKQELSASYSAYRAFRSLLQMALDQLENEDNLEVLAELEPSIVALHVLGRAKPPLLLPHRRLQWSIEQMAKWMKNNSEEETWKLVTESLDAYEKVVNSTDTRPDKEMLPEYETLRSLSPKLLELKGRRRASTRDTEGS